MIDKIYSNLRDIKKWLNKCVCLCVYLYILEQESPTSGI